LVIPIAARNLLSAVIAANAGIQLRKRFLFARRVRGISGLARPHAHRPEAPAAATRQRVSPP